MKAEAAVRPAAGGGGRPAFIRSLLAANLAAQGFYSIAFLPRQALMEALEAEALPEAVRRRYGIEAVGSLAVVAFRYGNGEYPPPAWAVRSGGDKATSLRIARFARANWYQEISRRMASAVAEAIAQAADRGIELPPLKRWHRLVNSGLPEKALALKSGLGWAGKNTIVIAAKNAETAILPEAKEKGTEPAFSSAVLLGLLLCPEDTGSEIVEPAVNRCGECRRCVDACPTGALGRRSSDAEIQPGRASDFDRPRCIQHWTSIDGEPPAIVRSAMRGILYGCDSCLEACPFFIPDPEAFSGIGRLGPALPASCFLEAADTELRRDLAGSVIDRAWMSMEAFRRNARLAIEPMIGGETGGKAGG